MPPRDLPGLYWDDETKRYFPLASRPAGAPSRPASRTEANVTTVHPQQPSNRRRRSPREKEGSPPRKRQHAQQGLEEEDTEPSEPRNTVWRSLNALKESPLGTYRRRCMHDVQIGKLSNHTPKTEGAARVQFDGPVTALCAKENEEILIGDTWGWLYSVRTDDPNVGKRRFGLRTQVTSISRSGPSCVATSFGSPSRLLTKNDHTGGVLTVRELPIHVCSDVWCGQVLDRKVIIGGRKAAVCFLDVEKHDYIRLPRSSDVLALCQHNKDITYMGMRNGIVDRWDSREPGSKTDLAVNMAERPSAWKMTPAIDYLRIVHGHELVIRTMRGELETHDMRFLRKNTPLLQFWGFSPTIESKLGITVDPGEDFLFSGGGDNLLHIWSLRTGQALPPRDVDTVLFSPESQVLGQTATSTRVTYPIRALEIIEEDTQVVLWMAFVNRLDRIVLGPKGLLL
ncbi:hypothetical protein BD309DRAFT_958449 [Dichomitus squalens]|uniref:Uncharacterized protein n=1 Tax=Dichomitus squalens TaxID=114155 RepID=A0A4Q9PXC9_9APHY|nr:hypothetical protein BD309DRAFT_958449 [Dichomitus squalens]TBU59235.1 hypothetical protein BD310DRAFT_925564 [Dichomitus squalens]